MRDTDRTGRVVLHVPVGLVAFRLAGGHMAPQGPTEQGHGAVARYTGRGGLVLEVPPPRRPAPPVLAVAVLVEVVRRDGGYAGVAPTVGRVAVAVGIHGDATHVPIEEPPQGPKVRQAGRRPGLTTVPGRNTTAGTAADGRFSPEKAGQPGLRVPRPVDGNISKPAPTALVEPAAPGLLAVTGPGHVPTWKVARPTRMAAGPGPPTSPLDAFQVALAPAILTLNIVGGRQEDVQDTTLAAQAGAAPAGRPVGTP